MYIINFINILIIGKNWKTFFDLVCVLLGQFVKRNLNLFWGRFGGEFDNIIK